jgi:hypothetical protein
MKNDGGWEAGKCSKVVPDRGDRCLLFFYEAIVFSATYFRFLFVELNKKAIDMKIGEAHKTRSSYLQSANTIGAPMPPAPIVVADRTRKRNQRNII